MTTDEQNKLYIEVQHLREQLANLKLSESQLVLNEEMHTNIILERERIIADIHQMHVNASKLEVQKRLLSSSELFLRDKYLYIPLVMGVLAFIVVLFK